jgi:hypothetical protein
MTDHITDTQEFVIQVIHFGNLDITNLVAPMTIVEGDGTQVISYDVTNIGSEDTVYGRAYYTETQAEIPNSRWELDMTNGSVQTKTFSVPAPKVTDTTIGITIVAGYVVD